MTLAPQVRVRTTERTQLLGTKTRSFAAETVALRWKNMGEVDYPVPTNNALQRTHVSQEQDVVVHDEGKQIQRVAKQE